MTSIPLGRPRLLGELVRLYGGDLDQGLEARHISAVATPEAAERASELGLLVAARRVSDVLASPAPVLVARALAGRVPPGRRWVHDFPWWVMSWLLEEAEALLERPEPRSLASDCVRAETSVVFDGAIVGPGCRLEPHSVVYDGVRLGARVVVGAGSVLGRPGFGFAHGPEGDVRRIPQLGGVEIGDDVEIGALCSVDAGTLGPTLIGAGTKLDAHVHIGHNARVGCRCFIAAQVGLAGSAEIGDDVWLGGQAGVADHVRVGRGARIAAKSGVISNVPERAIVAGYPAVSRVRWLRGAAGMLRQRGKRVG